MVTRTHDKALVGKHVFEAAGLGQYPYTFMGSYESVYVAGNGAPRQPGTCCDYCGTGIMIVLKLKSSDGKEFKVGQDCVNKAGLNSIIKEYKNSPEYYVKQQAKAAKKAQVTKDQLTALIDEYQVYFKNEKHPILPGKSLYDYATWMLQNSGNSGIDNLLARLTKCFPPYLRK
jgi:hypothetical protein